MKRVCLIGGVSLAAVACLGAAGAYRHATRDPNLHDPFNRTVGVEMVQRLLEKTPIAQWRFCRCNPDEELELTTTTGTRTRASLFRPTGHSAGSGFVLFHGRTALGRRMSTYRALASALRDAGYWVLVPDLPGFGTSTDPFASGVPEQLDRELEVARAAVEHLAGLLDGGPVFLVGHSRGAGVAFETDRRSEFARGVALIGPAVAWSAVYSDLDRREYYWRRVRETYAFVYGKPMPSSYTNTDWLETMRDWPSREDYAEHFSRPDHAPLLILEAENEEASESLASVVRSPSRVVTLPADHYLNTAQSLGFVIYDADGIRSASDQLTTAFGLSDVALDLAPTRQ